MNFVVKTLCCCALVVALTLPQLAEAKGYSGYYGYRSIMGYGAYGAGFGGGYRPYRYGAYSPYTRYYVYPMIWTHGTHQRGYSDPEFEQQLEDVMCKRAVNTTYAVTATSAWFSFDSRRNCFHQMSPEPGSPSNTPMTGLYVDVFRWNISVAQGQPLTVSFEFFSDQTDMLVPDFTYTSIIRNVTYTSSSTGATTTQTGDLFSYNNVQLPVLSTTAMANLMTVGVQSADQQTYATFQLSDDFVEDSTGHIFYRPDSLATTIQILPPLGDTIVSMGIEVLTNKSKDSYYAQATVGTVYDPPQMDRVSIGNMADQTDRSQGYISWRRTSQLWRPCLGSTYETQCISTGCEANGTNCGLSPDRLGDSSFSFQLTWNSSRPGGNTPFELDNIRMHMGYVDIMTIADSAAWVRPAWMLMMMAVAAAVMLML